MLFGGGKDPKCYKLNFDSPLGSRHYFKGSLCELSHLARPPVSGGKTINKRKVKQLAQDHCHVCLGGIWASTAKSFHQTNYLQGHRGLRGAL